MNNTLFDTLQVQRSLKQYYDNKLKSSESVRISDVVYIKEGISHYMYSFHLEYDEKSFKKDESLILRMGTDRDELRKEFHALEKLNSTSIPVPRVYDIGDDMLGFGFIIMEKVEVPVMFQLLQPLQLQMIFLLIGEPEMTLEYSIVGEIVILKAIPEVFIYNI